MYLSVTILGVIYISRIWAHFVNEYSQLLPDLNYIYFQEKRKKTDHQNTKKKSFTFTATYTTADILSNIGLISALF